MDNTIPRLYPIAYQPPLVEATCATCPYFEDYKDARNRGWCREFDQVTRTHHRRTQICDLVLRSLKSTKTFMVELESEEIEDDGNGHAVPVDSQIVEVKVTDSTRGAIEKAISLKDDLKGYQIVGFWKTALEMEF